MSKIKRPKIGFYGGARSVTGSNFLFETAGGVKVLIDCGLFQGECLCDEKNFADFQYDPASIDALLELLGRVGACRDTTVLVNDETPGTQPLVVRYVSQPHFGKVTISADKQSVVYQPDQDKNGADFFYSTSSDTSWLMGGNLGLGTTTPGAKLGIRGGVVVDDFVYMSSLTATSTTATSTVMFGMALATTTIIDGNTGRLAVGTTTVSQGSVTNALGDPGVTVTGAGSMMNATGTIYLAGGGANGGQIFIKSSNGTGRCIVITATDLGAALGTAGVLTTKTAACPK